MTDMLTNPVTRAVDEVAARIAQLDAEKVATLETTATLSYQEWYVLGDVPSRALLEGRISADVAQTLHAIHTSFRDGAPLADRIVFMQLATELLAVTS